MSSRAVGRGRRRGLIRSADIGYLQDAFLVSAVTGLLFNLLLLITIRMMISGEEELRRSSSGARAGPVAERTAVSPPPTPA